MTDELAAAGYESVYHARSREVHGEESIASYFHQYDRSKPYLIDHAFIRTDWLDRVQHFEIGLPDEWLNVSDHMPLVLDLELSDER